MTGFFGMVRGLSLAIAPFAAPATMREFHRESEV
jgi:hypothetical protein